ITLTVMSGKFVFSSASPDKVTFSGTVALPTGYNPKDPAGNIITFAMGNVIDVFTLDSKNKLVLPTQQSRITKFKLTTAKLPGGIAAGGEVAKVKATMNVADLDIQGFDAEGIQANFRPDEEGLDSVQRWIQVDMLLSETTYTVLAPVQYATSSSGSFG